MSLNNEQMLPARVRRMRQMGELLDAEDTVLAEMEGLIDGMFGRAAGLHEELVNEAWLEERLREVTGGSVDVAAVKDSLAVEVVVNKGDLSGSGAVAVGAFLDKWLPCHLAYSVTYEKLLAAVDRCGAVWQDDEIMVIRQVRI